MASRSRLQSRWLVAALAAIANALGGCAIAPQTDDVIIVAGQRVHTGTRVVTWMDAGGFDAYRTARLDASGNSESYGKRKAVDGSPITAGDFAPLPGIVDQIVLHYDGFGSSRLCFEHLAERQLSAHFLIDVDGTVYQTLDLQERAYHATVANNRSIGIEIANIGAFPIGEMGIAAMHNPSRGTVNGIELAQEDFTPAQYAALGRLIDALCQTFPRISRDFPRNTDGGVAKSKLSDGELANFRGILGHFHIQENKVDPGPAFQWERVLNR